jgi:hypothetical protein
MTTESSRLKDLALAWKAKAQAAHTLYSGLDRPDGPYQGARFSTYYGTYAVFSACAGAEAYLTEAAKASEVFWRDRECADNWTLTDLKNFAVRIVAYHHAIDKSVSAVRRAMKIEEAVEAGKLAAAKSEAAITEEIEAVLRIRVVFCGNDR